MNNKSEIVSPVEKTGKEKDNEPSADLKERREAPDVVDASEDDVQEAAFGDRSYAAPDFDKDKD